MSVAKSTPQPRALRLADLPDLERKQAWATWKVDGVRAHLVCTEDLMAVVNPRTQETIRGRVTKYSPHHVLDGELVNNEFLVFDALVVSSVDITKKLFSTRLQCIQNLFKLETFHKLLSKHRQQIATVVLKPWFPATKGGIQTMVKCDDAVACSAESNPHTLATWRTHACDGVIVQLDTRYYASGSALKLKRTHTVDLAIAIPKQSSGPAPSKCGRDGHVSRGELYARQPGHRELQRVPGNARIHAELWSELVEEAVRQKAQDPVAYVVVELWHRPCGNGCCSFEAVRLRKDKDAPNSTMTFNDTLACAQEEITLRTLMDRLPATTPGAQQKRVSLSLCQAAEIVGKLVDRWNSSDDCELELRLVKERRSKVPLPSAMPSSSTALTWNQIRCLFDTVADDWSPSAATGLTANVLHPPTLVREVDTVYTCGLRRTQAYPHDPASKWPLPTSPVVDHNNENGASSAQQPRDTSLISKRVLSRVDLKIINHSWIIRAQLSQELDKQELLATCKDREVSIVRIKRRDSGYVRVAQSPNPPTGGPLAVLLRHDYSEVCAGKNYAEAANQNPHYEFELELCRDPSAPRPPLDHAAVAHAMLNRLLFLMRKPVGDNDVFICV